jgi:hypothetical protein
LEKKIKLYLTEKEVSDCTHLALQTLRNARFNKTGIPYLRVMKRAIRYDYDDVIRWMESHRIETEGL